MFWLKVGLGIIILYVLIRLVKFFLRKLFNIEEEKREWFSYNHINKTHKKVDWFIRTLALVAQMTFLYWVIFEEYPILFFLVPMFLVVIADFSVRAFFEWKYSDNPKQAILTIGEMVVFVAMLAVTFQFDLLNLGY
ncbi:FlaA1/EpsC-like NDP-sugar epimerase [Planomicrobium stackebrandtii]|uniref:FlaA1/EpsC-like NDP-sugar epimerase n=1 Tax=Planomicrobium stackebrandtii TaxID=253160 RepID=A0ABU0GVQ8_9BACL|nr:DUF4181 domain-containing protein [Planomicrobium stackebrandtii]MDQ0429446.1 FlaA1/EpsC-like NDP-sugar epimerase [Planomicrobium stackebrandtii]